MRKDGNQSRMLLVDSSVLPKVFSQVLEAKELLASGKVSTAAEAARVAGISRSAFYKYRDAVYPYESRGIGRIITVYLELRDKPGVLSGCSRNSHGRKHPDRKPEHSARAGRWSRFPQGLTG